MFRTSTLGLIASSGAVLLLASWAFQQTLLDQANGEMQAIANAEGVYQTYQSNNALFNAGNEVLVGNAAAAQQVRRVQVYNYELGLRPVEACWIPTSARTSPPPSSPIRAISSSSAPSRSRRSAWRRSRSGCSRRKPAFANARAGCAGYSCRSTASAPWPSWSPIP